MENKTDPGRKRHSGSFTTAYSPHSGRFKNPDEIIPEKEIESVLNYEGRFLA